VHGSTPWRPTVLDFGDRWEVLYFSQEINMENQINAGDKNTQQIAQNPIKNQSEPANQNISTSNQVPPDQNRDRFFLIVSLAIAIIVLFGGGLLFFKFNQSKTGAMVTQDSLKEKKIVAIQHSTTGNAFYTFNPTSKEKNNFLSLRPNIILNEAGVSPDGKKLYYSSSDSFEVPSKITIVGVDKSSKEIDFAKSNLWTLSSPGILEGGLRNDCFWSPDSNKLACILIERESVNGAGTGRAKVSVFDFTSGEISDVLTSDKIAPAKRAIIFTKLTGWLGNNKLLIVQTKDNLQDNELADFYSLNIDTRDLTKEFSYRYENGFDIAVAPNKKQFFFQSFSRSGEDKFIKYDLDSKQDSVLATTREILGTTHPIISENGSKVVYTTYIFLKSVEEISRLRPEDMKGSGRSDIHVYDILSNEETTLKLQETIGFVEALLADGKTYILNKTPDGSILYDSELQIMDKIGGQFIGIGYF